MSRGGVTGQVWGAAKFVKLLPLLTVVALLAGMPAAVSGQTMPTVRITQSTIYVTEGTDSEAQVTVEISPAPSFVADVTIFTREGTADAPEDFEQLVQTIQFSSTVTSQTVSVEIKDDLIYEPPETIFVSLSSTDSRIIVDDTDTEIWIEGDEEIELALDSEMIIVREGSTAQLCVVRSDSGPVIIGSAISFDMHIRFTDSGGALVSGQDNPATVGIAAGSTEWCVDFNTQDVDDTTDVNFELRRTPLHPRDVRLSGGRYTTVRVVDTPDCPTNGAVTDPTNNVDLVADCNALLMAKEYLRGTATLNWSDSLAIGSWEGVTSSETPLRVTELNLGNKGLNGTIPPELGQLDRLKKLYLGGNSLTGGMPTELNSLLRIDEFYLNSNRLSGEIPDLSNLGSSLGSTAIIYFRLGNNELTGDIQTVQLPAERMKELDLSNNSLTGDPSIFLESIQGSVQYGSSGLTNIRLSQNSFDNCIPLSFVEELNERAKRDDFGFYEPSAGLQHDFGTITCDRVPFARRPAQDFNTLADAGNSSPEDFWTDGATVWVSEGIDGKIYAYNLSSKQRESTQDFNTLAAAGNSIPHGIWSDGTTMYVAHNTSSSSSKIYAYNLVTKQRDSDKDFNTLAPAGNQRPDGIWSDRTTMWVADWDDGKLYAYKLATKQRDAAKDFDTLDAAGNDNPDGVWSDLETMWVSDAIDAKIYAYNFSTKQRDAAKDFDTLDAAGNDNPAGIWSDGDTMWVTDWGDDKIYAYYVPSNALGGNFERDTNTRAVIDPDDSSPDPDPPDPKVIDPEKCVTEVNGNGNSATEEASGSITLGDTITGKWEAGCPSITRGARLAKYYTLTVPIISGVKMALDSHLDTYLVLRSGGLSGNIIAEDDDDGEGNNSLIEQTLPAGEYTIEATTFYSDGVEAEFTLTVTSVPMVLYDGPVSAVAHRGYAPAGPTMTVRLLPTLPRGSLEITIEDADGFGAGAGPLGGVRAAGGSAGTVLIALPRSVWVVYDELSVEVKESGSWSTHSQSDEQALLTEDGHRRRLQIDPGADAGADRERGGGVGTYCVPEYADVGGLRARGDTRFQRVGRHLHREPRELRSSQVVVPWLTEATETTGVRVSVPVENLAGSYLSVAASFVAGGGEQGLAQLHDLLDTGEESPECEAT